MKLRLIKTVIVKLVWFAVFALPLLDNCRLRRENESLKRVNVELRLKTGSCVKNNEIKYHHEQMDATLKRANERLEEYETRCSEMVAEKYRLLDDNINQLHARMNHLHEAMVVTEQIDDQQHYCPDYNYTSLEDRLHRAMHHLKRQKSSQLLAENRLKETTEMIVAEHIAGLDMRPVYQRHPDFTSDACGARIIASNGGIDGPGAIFGRVSLSHLPLQHNLQPGACWPCKVPDCLLRIKLCRPITPTALVIHHIPPDISPSPHGSVFSNQNTRIIC